MISRTKLNKIIHEVQKTNKLIDTQYLKGFEHGLRFVYQAMKNEKVEK